MKNAVTLFHAPQNPASTRVYTLLKQANATAKSHATEDQASSHQNHNEAQQHEFELDVTEKPPTSDQMKNILDYVGESNASSVIEGARDTNEALRKLRMDPLSLKRPLVFSPLIPPTHQRMGPLLTLPSGR